MDELIQFRQACIDDLTELVETAEATLTDDQQTRYDQLVDWIEGVDAMAERQSQLQTLAAAQPVQTRTVTRVELGHDQPESPNINLGVAESTRMDELLSGRLNEIETRDVAMAALERSMSDYGVDPDNVEAATRLLKPGKYRKAFAQHIATFGQREYAEGWAKVVTGRNWAITPEEQRALVVGTGTSAGNMVPTHLDPTIMLTNAGSLNPIRRIARVESLPSPGPNVWNGLTSAGVSVTWGSEAGVYTESSPVNVNPSIGVFKGMLHTKATEEALEDVAGLGATVLTMFADAKDRAESAVFITGDGTTQAQGILTALDANTNVELANGTGGSIALADITNTMHGVAVRWKGRGTWLMSGAILGEIQNLGSTVGAAYTTDLTSDFTDRLYGRPVAISEDMPTTHTSTTQVENLLIYGDFSNYVVVDKVGMRLQFYPVGVNASGVPDGHSGWLGHFRVGAEPTYSGDSTSTRAFVLLQDQTTA